MGIGAGVDSGERKGFLEGMGNGERGRSEPYKTIVGKKKRPTEGEPRGGSGGSGGRGSGQDKRRGKSRVRDAKQSLERAESLSSEWERAGQHFLLFVVKRKESCCGL